MELPKQYKTLIFQDWNSNHLSVQISEKEIPTPKKGEVLIQVFASPINPSDLMFLRGLYGVRRKPPFTAGFEGSGVVVATGENVNLKIGDRVSFVSAREGAWAEYVLTPENNCLPLSSELSLEEGSMLFVNPLTCYCLFEIAMEYKTPAIVQTAAASALGKMMIRLCKEKNVPILNIVRKEEHVQELMQMGAEFVLNSENENFEKEFLKLSKKLNTKILLDAVGGDLISRLFIHLPYNSKIISYGNLSEKNFEVVPGLLIFQKKSIEGFWLSEWIMNQSREEVLKISEKTQALYKKCFFSKIEQDFPLSKGWEAIEYYKKNMSRGKVIFKPQEK